jgi:hypothetical protein
MEKYQNLIFELRALTVLIVGVLGGMKQSIIFIRDLNSVFCCNRQFHLDGLQDPRRGSLRLQERIWIGPKWHIRKCCAILPGCGTVQPTKTKSGSPYE